MSSNIDFKQAMTKVYSRDSMYEGMSRNQWYLMSKKWQGCSLNYLIGVKAKQSFGMMTDQLQVRNMFSEAPKDVVFLALEHEKSLITGPTLPWGFDFNNLPPFKCLKDWLSSTNPHHGK